MDGMVFAKVVEAGQQRLQNCPVCLNDMELTKMKLSAEQTNESLSFTNLHTYRAFHRFGQAKFPEGGSVLSSSQFSILPQLPLKTMLGLKVVKIDSKVSNLLC